MAIIMDGNGRWAQSRGLPRLEGHRAGTDNVNRLLKAVHRHGIQYLTLFAFSTENWSRPQEEVLGLMAILREVVERETPHLHKENVRLRYLGRTDRLTPELHTAIQDALDLTGCNTGLNLNVAFDYGGRDEIIRAIRRILQAGISADEVTEEVFRTYLYTDGLPDPDLIIRTGGEQRLSNFLTWQSVYSEYYCSNVFWPDFDEAELERVLEAYSQRKRRFGGLDNQ
ncbi:MAG: di-trans,poly-cis-decaprenylcistransferase [Chloroflexi bacterium]|nr:di-trans,poly-cis-decaprenylcistransferase [Chloroflexota bacterium]